MKGLTGGTGSPGSGRSVRTVRLVAPAKLTVSLRVVGRRPDGYHELEAEMVSLDLADVLEVDPEGDGLEVVEDAAPSGRPGDRAGATSPVGERARPVGDGTRLVGDGEDNLVRRALAAVGRRAHVRLHKRVPVGGGLGGGSADAAAILRWAGCGDLGLAARLGADVPFCVDGGRALVSGIGEQVAPLAHVARSFVLLLPPFGVDTGAVYRAWDRLAERGQGPGVGRRLGVGQGRGVHEERAGGEGPRGGGAPGDRGVTAAAGGRPSLPVNDLTAPALEVEPRLAMWRDAFGEATGREPVLAGSGSTWWVEGTPSELGLDGHVTLAVGKEEGRLLAVRAVPARWAGGGVNQAG